MPFAHVACVHPDTMYARVLPAHTAAVADPSYPAEHRQPVTVKPAIDRLVSTLFVPL